MWAIVSSYAWEPGRIREQGPRGCCESAKGTMRDVGGPCNGRESGVRLVSHAGMPHEGN